MARMEEQAAALSASGILGVKLRGIAVILVSHNMPQVAASL
jgi:hypothetical protein